MPVKANFHVPLAISRPSRAAASTYVSMNKLRLTADINPLSAEVAWIPEATLVSALAWQALPNGLGRVQITGQGVNVSPSASLEVSGWINALTKDGFDNLGAFGGQPAWLPYVSGKSKVERMTSHYDHPNAPAPSQASELTISEELLPKVFAWKHKAEIVMPENGELPPLVLTAAELQSMAQQLEERSRALKDEIDQQVLDLKVRITSQLCLALAQRTRLHRAYSPAARPPIATRLLPRLLPASACPGHNYAVFLSPLAMHQPTASIVCFTPTFHSFGWESCWRPGA